MFKGSMVALVTPFSKGRVDEKALGELVEMHIKNGTSALVPCGTTGESATLSYEEHDRVIELTVQHARGRIPVIAGTGANSTDEAYTKYRDRLAAEGVGTPEERELSMLYLVAENSPTTATGTRLFL